MLDDPMVLFMLAQDGTGEGILPAPGEGLTGGSTGGGGGDQALPTQGPADPFGWFVPAMLVLFVVFIFFTMRGQGKEKKRRQQMIDAIKKHDTVQTVGGVIGSVVDVKPDRIVLKVDESHNTRMTFARSAVQQVLSSRGDEPAANEEQG